MPYFFNEQFDDDSKMLFYVSVRGVLLQLYWCWHAELLLSQSVEVLWLEFFHPPQKKRLQTQKFHSNTMNGVVRKNKNKSHKSFSKDCFKQTLV